MPFSGRLSSAGFQTPVLSRRSVLGNFFATAVATAAAKRSPELSVPKNSPLPEPKFNIGDSVAYEWEPDDEDAPDFITDFGEIMGMRWMPEPDGYSSGRNTWVYFVRWTRSTDDSLLSSYPCYDGEVTEECDLTLVTRV